LTKIDTMRIAAGWAACAFTCGVLLQAGSATETRVVSDGATATLLERLADSGPPLTSYRALRTLTAETRGGQMRARLTAWTSLDPAAGFQYSIVDEEGSGIIRQKVLRAALEAERKMQTTGEIDKGALASINYNFADGVGTGEGLMRIGIRPKRPDTLLVDGSILLTNPGGDLVRIEGALSKRPSFWTREVDVVRQYARIGGVHVPIEMRSVARVLLVGRSTFSMVYEYASINGSPVEKGATKAPDGESSHGPCVR
jgi:hypothetical protein